MQTPALTLVCIAKYKPEQFRQMMDTAEQWIDQAIVVLDEGAEDGIEGYKEGFAKYIKRPLNADFAGQRNFAVECARPGWILHIDTDENLTPELWAALKILVLCDCDIVELPRRNTVLLRNGTVQDWVNWPDWQPKLHRTCVRWIHRVHEWPDTTGLKVVRLGPNRSVCMTHTKTEEDQQRANAFYDTFEYHRKLVAS